MLFTLRFPPQQSQDLPQFLADLNENLVSIGIFLRSGYRTRAHGELFSGAGDGEAAIVEKLSDFQNRFDVLPLIYTMTGFGFARNQVGKLRFPESEYIGLNANDLADLTDAEEEFVRNLGIWHFSYTTAASIP
jgi:hypothetical protein